MSLYKISVIIQKVYYIKDVPFFVIYILDYINIRLRILLPFIHIIVLNIFKAADFDIPIPSV